MKIKKPFILLMIILQLFAIAATGIEPTKTFAQAETDAMAQGIQTLSEKFGINAQKIEQNVTKGYSLYDIQSALIVSKETGKPYSDVLKTVKPEMINQSETTISTIQSELPENYQLTTFSSPQNKLVVPMVDPSNLLKSISAKGSRLLIR